MPGVVGVTGAPGNVGTPLVRELLRRSTSVRVLARDVDKARRTLGDGPDYVHFEYGVRSTYAQAVRGLDKLFVTRPPQLSNVTRDMVPALDVALGAGVSHFALLSVQGAERIRVVPHARLEAYLRDSGADWTVLRPSFFLQNLTTTHLPELRQGEIYVPAGHGRTAFIDVRDVAEVAAVVLTGGGHAGQAYEVTGNESLPYDEVARIFSEATGRPIRYPNPSPIAFFQRLRARGTSASQVMVIELIYATARFGLAARTTPDTARLLGRAPRTVADFARDVVVPLMEVRG